MRFHQIRSNNRIYKVQVPTPPPPRSHPRPSVEPTRPPVPLLFFNNYPPTFNFFGPSMFINQNSPMNMPIPHFPGYVQSQTLIIAPQMLWMISINKTTSKCYILDHRAVLCIFCGSLSAEMFYLSYFAMHEL